MEAPGYDEDYVLLGFDEQKLHDKEAERSNHDESQTGSGEADENLSQEQSLSYKALLVRGLSSVNDGNDLGLNNPVEGFFSAEKMSKIGFSQDAPVEMFKNMSLVRQCFVFCTLVIFAYVYFIFFNKLILRCVLK